MAEKGCLKDGMFNNLEVSGLLAFNGTKIEFDDNLTLSSSTTQKPVLTLENTTNDANSAILKFVKDKGAAGAANDVNGLIQFFGDDANQDQVMFSELKSQVKVHTDGQEGGKLTFSVAEHDGTLTAGLTIEDGNADGELDVTIGAGTASVTTVAGNLNITSNIVPTTADGGALGSATAEWSDLYLADSGVIYFGNDQEVTLTHVADIGLTLKHTATADDKPITLTLATGETDIQVDDVIGSINFQAPDETTGTDAILVCAGISAVSEGDFSATNNATKLSFKTGASEAAAEKMSLSSTGLLTISGNMVVPNSGNIGCVADTDLITLADGIVTITGEISATTLDIGGTNIAATAAELNTYILNVELADISTASSCFIVAPKAGTLTKVTSVINGAINTANAVITVNINGGTDITQTLTIAHSGSAAGDIDTMTPGDNNTVAVGNYIKLTSDGASGNTIKAVFTLEITY